MKVPQKVIKHFQKLQILAEDLCEKAEKGLLRVDVKDDFIKLFHSTFSTNKKYLDEESRLEFEKHFETLDIVWDTGDTFVRRDHAINITQTRYKFINNALERLSIVLLPKTSIYIPNNKPYRAKQILKEIFSKAKSELILIDNYFHSSMLKLIEELYNEGLNANLKILRSDRNEADLKVLISDIPLLGKQVNHQISLFTSSKPLVHDRYIVIDRKEIFHSGHSFDQIGYKASQMDKVEDISQILQDYDNWLLNATPVI